MKRQFLLMMVVVVLVLGLASMAFAQAPENSKLVEDFSGATVESIAELWRPDYSYVELNTDPAYVKSGGASLKVTKDLTDHRQVNVLLSADHPNWNLLTENFKMSFWLYIDDYENIYENEWAAFLATHGGGEWISAILNLRQSQLEPGWNYIETYILIDDSIDELMFGFNYYGEEEVSTYIDEIRVW